MLQLGAVGVIFSSSKFHKLPQEWSSFVGEGSLAQILLIYQSQQMDRDKFCNMVYWHHSYA